MEELERIKGFNGDWEELNKRLNEVLKTIFQLTESPYYFKGKRIANADDLYLCILELYPEIKAGYEIKRVEIEMPFGIDELTKGVPPGMFTIIIIIIPGRYHEIYIIPPAII